MARSFAGVLLTRDCCSHQTRAAKRRTDTNDQRFDALVCTAREAHFGPFETVTEEELALGVHSKLLGQIRLVLLGRSLIRAW
jgi:hypothetical protein